jgi:hypothetical protein
MVTLTLLSQTSGDIDTGESHANAEYLCYIVTDSVEFESAMST